MLLNQKSQQIINRSDWLVTKRRRPIAARISQPVCQRRQTRCLRTPHRSEATAIINECSLYGSLLCDKHCERKLYSVYFSHFSYYSFGYSFVLILDLYSVTVFEDILVIVVHHINKLQKQHLNIIITLLNE